jgi:23S rRNA (cytosine1962-C5)-methyltransferase
LSANRRPAKRAPPTSRWLEPKGSEPCLELPRSLEGALALGHPWIYRDHVAPGVEPANGSWVRVRAGSFSAFALWDSRSPIALRVFSREKAPDSSWFKARLEEALALRAPLAASETDAYRLLYGEADGVPGLTVDVYGRYAVVVTYADSLERVVPLAVDALQSVLKLDGVVKRRRASADDAERFRLLAGREPPRPLLISEGGMRLGADLHSGQKTGLFLDHRENRAYIRDIAAGRSVLNLFSYTGAFSLAAALGGAVRVTSVDSAAPAMAMAHDNLKYNGVPASLHQAVVADVFEYLAGGAERFDIVISDPPSFASSQGQLFAALRAYTRLHALCLARVVPGGFFAAASCTAQVSPEAFRQTLAEAAARARVRLQLVRDAGHALDHPVLIGHPEGRYLKFMVARVLPLA